MSALADHEDTTTPPAQTGPVEDSADDEQPLVEDVDRSEGIQRDKLPQKEYYNKWDQFAKETEATLRDEEEAEKQASDEALGKNKYAMSEAEKRDKETHERLKEAKKAWDKRISMDEMQKFEVLDKENDTRVWQQADFEGRRVLTFKNCKDCTFELPGELDGLIKVFVEGCTNVTLTVRCKLITSYVEASHCKGLNLTLEDVELHTAQVDLCEDVVVRYGDGLFKQNNKIFSAGTRNMQILVDGGRLSSHCDFIRDLAPVVLHGEERNLTDPKSEEQHFITQMVDGELLTEVAVQIGDRWATKRELDLENASQAELSRRQMEDLVDRATRDKMAGNQAFQNAEYAQAAVHYTTAIDFANTVSEIGEPVPLLHVCFSNRAACFLKLGQPERALQDANSCIKANPDFVKGHFRRGLALHAMKRYKEALPSLGKASSLESPKNKASLRQIEEAIKFAEAMLAKQLRGGQ